MSALSSYPSAGDLTHIMAFDVESSGQNPRKFYMVELAVVVWELGKTEPVDSLNFYFGLDGWWDERTKKEFWHNVAKGSDGKTPMQVLRERLCKEKTPITPEAQAAVRLTSWAREWFKKTDGKIMCVTDTPGFDYQFITHMLACIEELPGGMQPPSSMNYLFGKYEPVCDINSFYKGIGGTLQKWGARDKMHEKFSVKYPDWVTKHEHNHDPRSDARSIAAKAVYILSFLDQQSED